MTRLASYRLRNGPVSLEEPVKSSSGRWTPRHCDFAIDSRPSAGLMDLNRRGRVRPYLFGSGAFARKESSMHSIRLAALAAALFMAAGAAPAQTSAAAAAQPAASAARAGPGGSGPMGRQGGMRGCCGKTDTSGWSMMSSQERQEHRTKVMGMKDYAECKAYMDEHHQRMVERAKEKGRSVPAHPRRDVCAGLKR